jgi:predicted nucleic acid-binding protein
MPRYYFDTSGLVKHYHTEAGSVRVDQILDEPGAEFLIARLTLAETISVLAKKVRTGDISDAEFDRPRVRFLADVANHVFSPVRMVNAHFDRAVELITRHGKSRQIHALDALQLSVALSLPNTRRIDHFVCADQRLCDIAILEGLSVINPEKP